MQAQENHNTYCLDMFTVTYTIMQATVILKMSTPNFRYRKKRKFSAKKKKINILNC